MHILIEKAQRSLTLYDKDHPVYRCKIALGRCPEGAKQAEGDGRTPEGVYYPCVIKPEGRWGRSIGISYPSPEDAEPALQEGRIDKHTLDVVNAAWQSHKRPPWGSPLGGEIYLHEGGTRSDWTQGCVALDTVDMDKIFPHVGEIDTIEIIK